MNDFELTPRPSIDAIVDMARAVNQAHRKEFYQRHHDIYASMSPEHYAREFKTVRVDVGRQIGKTSYLTRTAVDGDVILVGKASFVRPLTSNLDVQVHVVSINVVDTYPTSILKMHHTVWVDDASRISQEKLDMMYAAFASRAFQFVLLG